MLKTVCWISIITLLLLEISLRFVLGNLGLPTIQINHDDGLCVALKPSTSVEYTGWYLRVPKVHHDVNAQGYRGQERSMEKPVNDFRILMIGDSFTYGQGVNVDETIPYWLEQFLQEHKKTGQTVEVLNFGLPGLNLEDGLMVYRKNASKYKHDLVIYNFFRNDFDQSVCDLRDMKVKLWFFKNVYTFRLLNILLKWHIPPEGHFSPEEKRNRLLKTINGYLETSRVMDASFALVFLYEGGIENDIASFARQLSDEKKFFTLDVTSQCRGVQENVSWIHGDGHYTAEGNRFVAACIGEWLLDAGFLRKKSLTKSN